MNTLIQDARHKYRSGDPYWAADLMVELENGCRGKSLEWLYRCTEELVSHIPEEDKQDCHHWLGEFASLNDKQPEPSEVMMKGQTIWNVKRDIIHTAVGHLFAALAYYLMNDDRAYRTTIVRITRVIGDHEFYRHENAETLLGLFNLCSKGCNGDKSAS